MRNKLTLQLELKDIFFCLSKDKPLHENYIEFDGKFYIKRNYLFEFINLLIPFYNFAIWTVYTKEESQYFANYLTSIGAYLTYCRIDYYTFPLENGDWGIGKRLKRLHVIGVKIEEVICIESTIPIRDNHNNYFIIPAFSEEEEDNTLLASAIKLIELCEVENTTKINE
jgi:hypothetical protein